MSNKVHIALLLMCKNEKKRLHVTLESIIGHVDSIVAFDTGSTDNTVDILQEFSKKEGIPLRLKQGEFVNFSESRNESLDFADSFEDIDYLLLLDVNDELRGGKELREFGKQFKYKKNTGFLLCQEWWSGKYDKYYNTRFIKAHEGWRYVGSVHEYMVNINYDKKDSSCPKIFRIPDNILLYQDRTQDDNKSSKRFIRDKELLLIDYKKNPKDTRTSFYLAQTCSCLGQNEDAYYYYKIRASMEGFWEEKFQTLIRCGITAEALGLSWYDAFTWYMKAFEYSERVEPLIKIIQHYIDEKKWLLAYTFVSISCKLKYPEHCILFVDKNDYDYKRWHFLGIIGWYSKNYEEGKIGCLKAIECGLNNELDTNNLKFYEDKEKEECVKYVKRSIMTKKEFLKQTKVLLNENHPSLNNKQKDKKALKLWKDYRKK
jgi:glycosyltransferase involved in cell wall biosynthesis